MTEGELLQSVAMKSMTEEVGRVWHIAEILPDTLARLGIIFPSDETTPLYGRDASDFVSAFPLAALSHEDLCEAAYVY